MAFKVKYSEALAKENLVQSLVSILKQFPTYEDIVCVCIGTDRSTGDSLGPLVGSFIMKERKSQPLLVHGTLDKPVHALNLNETLSHIEENHPHSLIIAIDACLGQLKQIGFIQLGLGSIQPGAGVNKNLPSVGQIHITGIVNIAGFMEFMVLQNTRLSLVMNMAEIISSTLLEATQQLYPSTLYPDLIYKNHNLEETL